jgi:solute carrier family 20 (sodium-dependent phosphate transporter)
MTWAGAGSSCLNWEFDGIGGIFASWVISPVLSGLIGAITFLLTEKIIFQAQNPRERAIIALPVFITLVTFVISFLICLKSPMTKNLEIWVHFTAAICVAFFSLGIALFFVLPWTKRNFPSLLPDFDKDIVGDDTNEETEERPSRTSLHIMTPMDESNMVLTSTKDALLPALPHTASVEQLKDAMFCFRILLVCNAALESFAHGANDTANCTGPFRAVLQIYQHGLDSCHDAKGGEWVMVLAGAFVGLGVITFGKNVIETVGKHLTLIDYQRGFCIEFSSCVTVVLATMLELPVSTTHCQIGSVVFVGLVSMGREHVAWSLVGKILMTWVITLPFSGAISIFIMEMIKQSITR